MSALGKRDRMELMSDAEYFLTEAIRRFERLARREPHGPTRPVWQQSAGLSRKVRGSTREQIDKQRRKEKLARVAEELRVRRVA